MVDMAIPWGVICFAKAVLTNVLGQEVLAHILEWLTRRCEKLPSRHKKVLQTPLCAIDRLYLAVNLIVIEPLWMLTVVEMARSPTVPSGLGSITLLNTFVALWLFVICNELFQTVSHWALHRPFIYGSFHKHHHRAHYPSRGLTDAVNSHPVDQLVVITVWRIALEIVIRIVGMHVITLGAQFLIMAVWNWCSHSERDIRINILGLDASVRHHEMHHRYPDCNFGLVVPIFDDLMGTTAEYQAEGRRGKCEAPEPATAAG